MSLNEVYSRNSVRRRWRRRSRPLRLESLEARRLLAVEFPIPEAMIFVPEGQDPAPMAEFNNSGSQWPQSGGAGNPLTVTYSYSNLLDGILPGGLTADQLRAATEEALGLWAAYAPLHFVEQEDSGPAASDDGYSASGRPQLRFGHHYIDGGSGENTLAHAYYPGSYGLAGDVHFDNSNTWKLSPSGGVDILEVMTHELGHSLGLGHEESGITAIMNPYYGGRYSGLGTGFLLQDDINGIRDIYGTGVGSVAPLPREPIAVDDAYTTNEDGTLAVGVTVETVVAAGSGWSYLDDGSNQGTAWRDPTFDDSAWTAGVAPLGYGGDGEVTEIGYGGDADNKYVTTYFRRHVALSDVGDIDRLELQLLRDDGGAVYLNGVEIARDNLDAGAGFQDEASGTVSGGDEGQFVPFSIDVANLPAGTLVEGVNLLAVEIHQAGPTSSDVSFDLGLDTRREGPAGVLDNDADPEALSLTAVLVDAPAHGTLVLQPDGTFQYTPDADFFGLDGFTYRADNGQRQSDVTTAAIDVLPQPDVPQAVDDSYQLDEDGQLAIGRPTIVAVPAGSVWRYSDDGSDLGVAWRDGAFDDGAWLSGPAQLGYGDADEATVVRYSNDSNDKFATTYFRTTFDAGDVSEFVQLTLHLLRDDAAAVYLNGQEVYRDATLVSDAGFDEYATETIAEENVFVPVGIDLDRLAVGTNTIAVEVHQASPTSSDLSFDLKLIAADALSAETLLVDEGALWKYRDDGSDQGTAWYGVGFDDAAWLEGPAQLGYGDDDEATAVRFARDETNKFITTYFRREFDVESLARLEQIEVRLLRDDGAAVYLNGVELRRDHLAPDAAFDELATDTVGGSDEDRFFSSAYQIDLLPPGALLHDVNVLAVEVHQAAPDSSDVGFDLELLLHRAAEPEPTANDVDLDQTGLVLLLESSPTQGTLAADSDGTLIYTPQADFSGDDSFTYRVRSGQSVTVLPLGSDWHYFDEGTDQGVAWRDAAFDHASWPAGPAELGYGDGDEATEIDFGGDPNQKHATTYFRTTLTLADAVADPSLLLKRDDAAAVYLDGQEVFRDAGLPADAAFDVYATGSRENRETTVDLEGRLLLPGEHTLAVEVHQSGPGSSDVSFDLQMSGKLASTPATVTLIVDPVNDLPNAVDDAYEAIGDRMLSVGALEGVAANDADVDNTLLTAVLTRPAAHGTVALAADGSFTYEPEPDFVGSDSFGYQQWDGQQVTLLSIGGVWKYLDDGSDQAVAWSAAAFDDSNWQSGPAELGYGDDDEATVVDFGGDSADKFATTYFRTTFMVDDATRLAGLVMQLLRDDAAAVYLNGAEVYRDTNLADGASYDAYATGSIGDDEDVLAEVPLDAAALVDGTNTIAVEIHQATPGSSDVSFDLGLSAALTSNRATVALTVIEPPTPEVVGRHVFYNNSAWDGWDPALDERDADAIATDKTPLLPGHRAAGENVTGFAAGINGIMVDLANVPDISQLRSTDFEFHAGNSANPGSWTEVSTVDARLWIGGGVDASTRVAFSFDDEAIAGRWLRATVLAGDHTGLGSPDVFYFGNAVGATNAAFGSLGAGLPIRPNLALVGAADVIAIRDNPRGVGNPASIDDPHDLNRDRFVDGLDLILARDNATSPLSALRLIMPQGAPPPAAPSDAEGQGFGPAGREEPPPTEKIGAIASGEESSDAMMALLADRSVDDLLPPSPTLAKLVRRLGFDRR